MVTLYSTPTCQPCKSVARRLTAAGIEFEKVDITVDTVAADRLKAAGFSSTPVLEHNGELTTIVGVPAILAAHA